MDNHNTFIGQLSQDLDQTTHSVLTLYLGVLGLAVTAVSVFGLGGLIAIGNSIRPDYMAHMAKPIVFVKQLVPLIIALVCLPLIVTLARPEAKIRHAVWPLIIAMLMMPIMLLFTLSQSSSSEWGGMITGALMLQCAVAILLFSLVLIAVQIIALRHGAVTRPHLTGTLIGLMSGSLGIVLYALFCTEDSPGFYGLWYSGSICLSGLMGTVAGRIWLRW